MLRPNGSRCRRVGLLALLTLASASLAIAQPMSQMFPYCWQGYENTAVYYTEGLLTRQIVLYANASDTVTLTKCELVLDFPAGAVEVVKAVACDGPDRVKTEARASTVSHDGMPYDRTIIPLWDIRPGFRWKGTEPWSQWPGWWTAVYVKGKTPGRYGMYWHIRSAAGTEAERMAPLVVLPRPASPARLASRPGGGLGVWLSSLSLYGEFPEVAHAMAGTLRACGVQRVYLGSRDALSVRAARAAGLQVFLTNPWEYSVFAPTEPSAKYRACNAAGQALPGKAWCPTYVSWAGEEWRQSVEPRVTGDMKALGADGYMLDYEGAAAPGYKASDICFCSRCQQEFAKALGSSALNWPADVRPGGRYHDRWLQWRQDQGALYVKRIADLARAARPDAQVFTWTGGAYQPHGEHDIYRQAASDITRFARHVTATTVGTYVYPNHADPMFVPTPGFGEEPGNWGRSLVDMLSLVRWTTTALSPRPVIPCVAGAHPPSGTRTPLAAVDLLRIQAANHLLDGAPGLDFWGIGPLEDGRYLGLMAELAGLFGQAEPYLAGTSGPLPGVANEGRRLRAGVLTLGASRLVVLINGYDRRRVLQARPEGGQGVSVPPWGVLLLPEGPLPALLCPPTTPDAPAPTPTVTPAPPPPPTTGPGGGLPTTPPLPRPVDEPKGDL